VRSINGSRLEQALLVALATPLTPPQDIVPQRGLQRDRRNGLANPLARPPDVVLIYAGHNELCQRYPWDRNVRYYVDESPEPRRWLEELVRAHSWFGAFLVEQLERNRVPYGPPDHVTRELVDHPVC